MCAGGRKRQTRAERGQRGRSEGGLGRRVLQESKGCLMYNHSYFQNVFKYSHMLKIYLLIEGHNIDIIIAL